MSQVFISYRQTDDDQRKRVRAFAERLRDAGVDVILDQFLLDDHPEGPHEGWDKWSSDCAINAEYVLIIGTNDWFECFNKTQPRGTGLGAACEADDIRDRIYEAGGIIESIRVVLFDEVDSAYIPAKLRRYHRFHSERDLTNIIRWLNRTVKAGDTPRTSIPHNLPSLQPFFGREEELRRIADALDPESRTWGALIDGPGGMGKTSLAVRAAYDAPPGAFEKIVYVSLKSRELDDDGVRDLSGFLISGLAELLNELARELGHSEIAKVPENERPRKLLNALRGTHTLLVLDNLESLIKKDRDIVFTFVKRLPVGCKAILTSRQRIGSAAEELILEKLSEEAALATLANLAESNPALAKTSEVERCNLYRETGGKPLLLRWTAGQIGRGSCINLVDAIGYLRSCPEGNDPLEFVFGDLIENFSASETHLLCALTYFTHPAKVEHLAGLAECPEADADRALRSLVNRSLVVPNDELRTFVLGPLVADFLRKKKPEVVAETGNLLEKRAYALIVENGYNKHHRFHLVYAAWPMVSAAMPRFLAGRNDRLQTFCDALFQLCNFSGRFDESLALNKDAERVALSAKDFSNAGWRAYQAGWIHYLREQSEEVLDCANRSAAHWAKAQAGFREQATAIRLRGLGHSVAGNHVAAISAYQETVSLLRRLGDNDRDIAIVLNSLAIAEDCTGDLEAADRDYTEALQIALTVDYREGIAYITGNLAELALYRDDLPKAESLARKALARAEEVGRQDLIARDCRVLARTLVLQGRRAEGLPHARRSVQILTQLDLPELDSANKILEECEN